MAPEHQAARGVAVEPMRKGWPARQAKAQGVEVILKARAALRTGVNRDSRGLVENENHPVAVEEPRYRFFRHHGETWYGAIGCAPIGRG